METIHKIGDQVPKGKTDFLDFLRKGAKEPGDCGSNSEVKPAWLDKEKLLRIKDIFEDESPGILLGHFMGQALMSQVASLAAPLVHTGNHSTKEKASKRAAMTLRFVIGWYKGKVWDPKDSAHKSVLTVRRMHKSATTKLTTEIPKKEGGGHWISQFDMALTQFAFLGALVLYSEQVGLYCTQDEMECLVHFWRYIGYLLGIKDEYNLGSLSYSDMVLTFKDIVREISIPAFTHPVEEFTAIGMSGTEGYSNFALVMDYNAMHNFTCQLLEVEGMWRELSWKGYANSIFLWLAPKILKYPYLRKLTVPGYGRALEMKIDSFFSEQTGYSNKTIPEDSNLENPTYT